MIDHETVNQIAREVERAFTPDSVPESDPGQVDRVLIRSMIARGIGLYAATSETTN